MSKARNRDDLISPDLQRGAIIRYAAQVGIRITAWREALDESGSQTSSRWWVTLDQIITEVEAGHFQAVVAWKYSRAARNRLRWAIALDRIEKAGATLESATEGVDTTTSTGRFTRGMLAELAAFEAERIGEVWKEVKQRRTTLGLADGQPRFGYDLEAGIYRPGVFAPVLRVAYEQAAVGVSFRAVTDEATGQGAVTKYGNPYTPWHFARMLRAGFGAGLLQTPTGYVQGVHEPIIGESLWEQFRQRPQTASLGMRHGKHPLSGLLRCAYCLKPLHAAHRAGAEAGMYWRCPRATPDCPGTYGWAPKIDRLLNEWLTGLLEGADPLFQQLLKAPPAAPDLRARRKLVKVEKDLLLIAEKNLSGFYDDPTYHQLRGGLLDEQRLLRKALATEAAPLRRGVVEQALSGEDRNTMLRFVLAHVLVLNGERPKYRIVPAWRG